MAPKRKASASKASDHKKPKKELPSAKPSDARMEPAEVWYSVEHWAAELCKLLQERCPELDIKLNPSKPRKGCFEIQDQSGKTYVSLLNMPRPFKQLRELDVVKVANDMAANLTAAAVEKSSAAIAEDKHSLQDEDRSSASDDEENA